MWDDDSHEKRMARNHMIAVVLLVLVTFGYLFWLNRLEQRYPRPVPTPAETQAEAPAEPAGAELPPETPAPVEAGLPPVPETVDPAADEVEIRSEQLHLTLTRIGGRLKQAYVQLGEKGEDTFQLIPSSPNVPDTEAVYPLGLTFNDDRLGEHLNRVRWEVLEQTDRSVTFGVTLPGYASVRKRIALDAEAPHLLDVRVEYQNLQDRPYLLGIDQTPGYTLYWGPGITPEAQTAYWGNTLVWRTSAGNERMDASDLENRSIPRVEWVAEKTAYFAVALKPEFENAIGRIAGESLKNHRIGVAVPSAVLEPGQTVTSDFRLYAGPSHLEHLEAAWPTLPSIQRFFDWDWLNWFAVLLLNILNFFYGFIPNYGVAIILLTVLVRVAVFPLTLKQMKSMKRMQALAPEMEALKKKYGEDQQELSRKMMELYRERGVSPLGGCLPLFVQMPVFIALWRMLAMAFEIRGADFVGWIDDLSSPDRLFHLPWLAHVPIVGQYVEYINLLPILVMGAMVLSMRLMPTPGAAMQNPQQKMIMNLMPIIFGLFCYTQPSGLCLYLLVSTLLGVVQQQVTQHIHMDVTSGPPPKKTPRKRRHWYAAAQEKKRRQLKQETKQGTKR